MILKDYLLIFQLEEYKIKRLLTWVFRLQKGKEAKKSLVMTPKATYLYRVSLILFALISGFAFLKTATMVAVLFIAFLWANSYILLIVALILRMPYEIINRKNVIKKSRKKIDTLKNTTIIVLTGSFGKTSTKHVLRHLLGRGALETPKSFNTLFGIEKVVRYELDGTYKYFLCEMGAYKTGEIKEMCKAVPPDIALVTGLNEQHLERFKDMKNTIKAKFEAVNALKAGGSAVINLDNEYVLKGISAVSRRDISVIGYTLQNSYHERCREIIKIGEYNLGLSKTTFEVEFCKKVYKGETGLLGKAHLTNILASLAVAYILNIRPERVMKKVRSLEQLPHRLEIKREGLITILDDTYSSNPTGFREALKIFALAKGRKIIATPGIVELGKKSRKIHKALGGEIAQTADILVLIGKSKRTKGLREGFKEKKLRGKEVVGVANQAGLKETLRKILKAGDTVLFENDLPNQYL